MTDVHARFREYLDADTLDRIHTTPPERAPDLELLQGEVRAVAEFIGELLEDGTIRICENPDAVTAFEGIDGTGKTTAAIAYAERQSHIGKKVVFLTMSHASSNRASEFIQDHYTGEEQAYLLSLIERQFASVHNFAQVHNSQSSEQNQIEASIQGIREMNLIINELVERGYQVVTDKWLIANFLGGISLFRDKSKHPVDDPHRFRTVYRDRFRHIIPEAGAITVGRIFVLNANYDTTVGRRHSRGIPGDRVKSPPRFERRRLDFLLISRYLAEKQPERFLRVIANGSPDMIMRQVARVVDA